MESLNRRGIVGGGFRQKLDRDYAAKGRVFGPVHHTHPAFAQALQDSIVGDDVTDHGSRHIVSGQEWKTAPGGAIQVAAGRNTGADAVFPVSEGRHRITQGHYSTRWRRSRRRAPSI